MIYLLQHYVTCTILEDAFKYTATRMLRFVVGLKDRDESFRSGKGGKHPRNMMDN